MDVVNKILIPISFITHQTPPSGMLRNDGPPSWHFATPELKALIKEAGELCKKNGVELGKIAMYHTIQLDGPATFLSGMEKMIYLDYNLGAYLDGLTDKEMEIYKTLMEK